MIRNINASRAVGVKKTEQRGTLVKEIKSPLEPATRGDPMRPLLWVSRSLAHITKALKEKGYEVSTFVVRWILKSLGYRLQANRKTHEGGKHPDRNAQFLYIPRLRQNPKIFGIDDAEIVGDGIAVILPVFWDFVAQEAEDGGAEVAELGVAFVMSDVPVHQPP